MSPPPMIIMNPRLNVVEVIVSPMCSRSKSASVKTMTTVYINSVQGFGAIGWEGTMLKHVKVELGNYVLNGKVILMNIESDKCAAHTFLFHNFIGHSVHFVSHR